MLERYSYEAPFCTLDNPAFGLPHILHFLCASEKNAGKLLLQVLQVYVKRVLLAILYLLRSFGISQPKSG